MILLAHPSGNNFVRETAMAFFDAKALRELHLGIAACGENGFAKLSRLPGMAEIRRRTYDSRLRSALRLHPWREGGRLLASRLGWRSLIAHETGPFCVDAVFENFDRSVARRVATLCRQPLSRDAVPTGVYCYEDGALETFRAAKAAGIVCCYDLPIAYWRTARKFLEEEAERWPQWEPTLVGTRDSVAKCARKDAELEMADLIVCPSKFVRDSLPSEVLLSKTVAVIPFGSPDSPRDFPSRKKEPEYDVELNRDDLNNHSRLRILFAGSMTQRKGLADLFAAMKLLDPERIELHVMGSPIVPIEFYRSQYPHFVYHATRSNADVLKLMQTMDVFCLPSLVEGRALVIQEAMSQGLPIIITPNTGGEDLVEVTHPFQESVYGRGATGFLVPIRSPETIAECIAWCCDHREEVVAMGHAAMSKSQEYTWKAYGDGIVYAVQDAVRAR